MRILFLSLLVLNACAATPLPQEKPADLSVDRIFGTSEFSAKGYPNRSHSISEGANTPRHLWELITRYLLEKLPPNRGGNP